MQCRLSTIVDAAQTEAARLLETAQTAVRDAEQHYTDVYGAATASGWAPADLAALGFSLRPRSTRRRRASISEPSDLAALAIPEQPADSAIRSPAG